MKTPINAPPGPVYAGRRRFVQGLALGSAAAAFGLWRQPAWALTSAGQLTVLRGTEFTLDIAETAVNFTGSERIATAINGQVPAPILRFREGDTVTLRVSNHLRATTSVHWHGILLPNHMDGVPGLSYNGIAPGETFVYRYTLRQSGTYWYHSHSRFQEQTGLYGPLIVEPRGADPIASDRDYVVMLSDWTDEDPMVLFGKLKKMSDYYNFNQPTVADFLHDARRQGIDKALAERRMWNRMRMSPSDLADVTGATYTYLMNGTTPAGNWTGIFKPGERVRLRFINGSAMSFFDVRIPGVKMTVVAADGQNVAPVDVDEFRIAVAETYDVIVQPQEDRAYTLFAQSMDRTGYARGTLAPRRGMQAEVPAVDPAQPLAMIDMMGAMADATLSPRKRVPEPSPPAPLSGREGSAHRMHGMGGMAMSNMPKAHHASSEYGPGTDMRVDHPRENIDDPGVGLRDNGRRVLTYADLHTLGGPIDEREPGRTIELHLTGNMERYMWSFDGQKFADSRPLHFHYGERLRIVLVNDTMMTHPIHLHGLWSELEAPDGSFQVRKHTISVQPAQRVAYQVSADARGNWAYHCHLLYHMEAGMFREVVVS